MQDITALSVEISNLEAKMFTLVNLNSQDKEIIEQVTSLQNQIVSKLKELRSLIDTQCKFWLVDAN